MPKPIFRFSPPKTTSASHTNNQSPSAHLEKDLTENVIGPVARDEDRLKLTLGLATSALRYLSAQPRVQAPPCAPPRPPDDGAVSIAPSLTAYLSRDEFSFFLFGLLRGFPAGRSRVNMMNRAFPEGRRSGAWGAKIPSARCSRADSVQPQHHDYQPVPSAAPRPS